MKTLIRILIEFAVVVGICTNIYFLNQRLDRLEQMTVIQSHINHVVGQELDVLENSTEATQQ